MLLHAFFKPPKPLSRHAHQEFRFKQIRPASAAPLHADQAGRFEDSQMARRCRPTVLETLSYFTSGHSSVVFAKRKKDLPTRTVGQGSKHRVGYSRLGGRSIRFRRHSVSKVLADLLIGDNFYF
jgi:hypothetical protein